jgi:hypothetical protein
MRIAFLTLALLLAAALGWLALATESGQPSPLSSTVSAQEAPVDRAATSTEEVERPRPLEAAAEQRSPEKSPASAKAAPTTIRFNELELLGLLVSEDGSPRTGYTVLVAPTGFKPQKASRVPPAQRCVTDAEGNCAFTGLDVPGPWDVYAFPMDLGAERSTLLRRARVGTVTAGNPGETQRVTFTIATGPTVILRSPLPDAVEAEDLWFEVLPRSGEIKDPLAKTTHRFSQGAPTDEGQVTALLPPIDIDPFQQVGYSVHVRTLDGLFSLVSTSTEKLAGREVIVIDEPLEERGCVKIQVELRDLRQGADAAPLEPHEWQQAVEVVGWRLLLDDPSRGEVGLPASLQTKSQNQRWAPLGNGKFELTDLPIGVPIELGALGSPASSPGNVTFVPETLVRATPVHGDPEPARVRIRRVR